MKELAKEKTMTTKEIANIFKCDVSTIRKNARKCLPNKIFENGKQTYWTEKEITILTVYMKQNNNRADLQTYDTVAQEKLMTTKEVAKVFGCKPAIITENAKKCLPNKIIQNGKPTFWNEKEVTLLKKYIVGHNAMQSNKPIVATIGNVSTELEDNETIIKAVSILQRRNIELKQKLEVSEERVKQLEYNATENVYGAKEVARIIAERSGEPFSFRKVKPIAVELGIFENPDFGRMVDFASGHHNGRTWQYSTKAVERIWDKVCED